MTAWNANGANSPVNWTVAHDKDDVIGCTALVKIQSGKFVPQFGQPGKPFVCLSKDDAKLPDNPTVK